ncbi:MBL fold metallo-hydrolase [Ktedonobacter racemifer]|uniref:Zn-dependent hydrolase n=1 Tax=Ktedonobacter racemifer DSM 44963 TaxID=485913 RepID=D6TL09_KTERA|nr:MBL fold metallo-hydrolase [Ktedonobacter racemifer]EFH86459.1 Zn-dependent hydrolase [Ktedonobacter racemifer DSM 44963]
MTEVTQLTPGIWQISLPFQGETDIIGSYLLAGSDEIALIDPGPGSTSEALLEGVRQAGFDPARVTHILATHIHLDHTGGVGKLLASMPQARVFVHSKGAQHLIDPGKLISSSERIYGERMQELWGEILPVPQEKVQVIEGGDVLNIAGRRLEVHYTPGHAIHHVIFFDVHSGDLFAGDVAGVRLPGITYGRPPTPPPDLDIEAWSSSIDTLKKLRPDVIYLAHFGPVRNLAPHLESIRAKLFNWGDLVLRAMRENKSEAEIIELFIAETRPELQRLSNDPRTLERYEIASNYPMTVQGYMRYWRKHHPERLEA